MFMIIMVNGAPCTGKTTTARTIHKFLQHEHGMNSTICERSTSNYENNMNLLGLVIYKWLHDSKKDQDNFLIIDSPAYNVFERKDIFDMINKEVDAGTIDKEDLMIVSVTMSRSNYFPIEHNSDKGHRPYTKKLLQDLMRVYQQPITREGFDLIYRVAKDAYIQPWHLFDIITKTTGVDYSDFAKDPNLSVTADETVEKEDLVTEESADE